MLSSHHCDCDLGVKIQEEMKEVVRVRLTVTDNEQEINKEGSFLTVSTLPDENVKII